MTIEASKIPASLVEAFDQAVASAQHLDERDVAAVVNARKLAAKIDRWDDIVDRALADAAEAGDRPRVPQNDNVSPSAFAKACDALGLTPIGRKNIDAGRYGRKPEEGSNASNGKPTPGRVSSIAARREARTPGSA
jgi:hypothetical protein